MDPLPLPIDLHKLWDSNLHIAAKHSDAEDNENDRALVDDMEGRPKRRRRAPAKEDVDDAPAPAPAPRAAPRARAPAKAKVVVADAERPERARLVRHIRKYTELAESRGVKQDLKLLPKVSDKMSIEDLRELKQAIRGTMHMGRARDMVAGIYETGLEAVEAAGTGFNPFGVNFEGLVHEVRGPSAYKVDPYLDELAIEFDDYFNVDPKLGLLLATGSICAYVDKRNRDGAPVQ